MTRRLTAILLAMLALLSACGDDGDEKSSSSSGTKSEEAAPRSEAELKAALLTQADVPSGMTPQPEEDEEDEEEAEGTAAESCLEQDVDDLLPPAAKASAQFATADTLRSVQHELRSYEGDDASKSMEEGRKLIEKCRTFEEKSDEGSFMGSIKDLTFPSFGDDTAAFVIEARGAGFTVGGHFVVVRKGSVTTSVGNLVVGGAPDQSLTESLVRKAVEKLG